MAKQSWQKEWKGPASEKKGLESVTPETYLAGGGVGAAVMRAGAKALARAGSRLGSPATGVGKAPGSMARTSPERAKVYGAMNRASRQGYDPRNSADKMGSAYKHSQRDTVARTPSSQADRAWATATETMKRKGYNPSDNYGKRSFAAARVRQVYKP